jgi:DNA-binding MarR family transcriptional regulator
MTYMPERDAVDEILEQWSAERPDLDTSRLSVVVRVMALYKPFLRQATRALDPLQLELWEYDVLSALRRQGKPFSLPATALAHATGLSTGAMTNRIDKLEARGFVDRKDDPHDRRSVIVKLTPQGMKIIDKSIQLRLEAANQSLRALRPEEREALGGLLRKVVITSAEIEKPRVDREF